MDWLEEKWEAVKSYLQNASLLRRLWGYALLTVITILVCTQFTKNISISWFQVLQGAEVAVSYVANGNYLYVSGMAGWQSYRRVVDQVETLTLCAQENGGVPTEPENGKEKDLRILVKQEGDLKAELFLDMDAVMEAFENILNNSLRLQKRQLP